MKKFVMMAAVALFSVSAMAGEVGLSVTPESPLVVDADLTLPGEPGEPDQHLSGPYFAASYTIANTSGESITIVGMKVTVVSVDGVKAVGTYDYAESFEIPTGYQWTTGMHYLGGLPQAPSFEYQVTVKLLGWVGTPDNAMGRLNTVLEFVTQ